MRVTPLLAGVSMFAFASAASATTFSFSGTANDSNSQIQTFMNGQLSGESVTVTGAIGSSVYEGSTYNADGHVVGPTANPQKSYTLLNLDGAFIMTNPGTTSEITMTFSQPVASVSFDAEIFPNNSCTAETGSNCGGTGNPSIPDLKFIDGNSNATLMEWVGVVPGAMGSYNTAWVNSPLGSAATGHNPETAPQLLIADFSMNLPANTTELVFEDWPAAIGISNLTISTDSPPVPEPASLTMLGSSLVLLGFTFAGRRQHRRGLQFA